MIELHRILYVTVKDFETAHRLEDPSFDGFDFLSKKIGHKNSSTLRKMCEPKHSANGAKLGVEDAMIIMDETGDYRLLQYVRERLKQMQQEKRRQLSLFSEPLRTLEDVA